MRIGISTSVIQRGQTGIGQYVLALTREFLNYTSRHEFTLFILEEDLPLFDFARGRMQFEVVNERYRPAIKNIWWHQRWLPRRARELGLDALHIPSYRRLLWSRSCPTIATIHDLAPFHVSKKYDWKRMLYARFVVRQLVHRQDSIIAISHQTARDITRFFGVAKKDLTVVHNGLDHERFYPGSQEKAKKRASRAYGLERPFFLYVARLEHPGKNHVRLIEAFNQLKEETRSNWQLVFAGGDWHGADVVHQTIQRSAWREDIRCLGFVADAELPELYRASDAFVFPSLYEGFGLPPLEAMACGCPVLTSARGSLQEVVGDSAATVDPESISALKDGMIRLSCDAVYRHHLHNAGLARARSFHWSKAAEAHWKSMKRPFSEDKVRSVQNSIPLNRF
jgi:glycosyltransferase involved in cell wall biosynthesis